MVATRVRAESKREASANNSQSEVGEVADTFMMATPDRFKVWLMTNEDRLPDDFEMPDA